MRSQRWAGWLCANLTNYSLVVRPPSLEGSWCSLLSWTLLTEFASYRRGKPESNDVDIVITHPDPSKVKGLCKKFVKRLSERGQ